MKGLERRIADLEGVPNPDLWHLSDDELGARIVVALGAVEGEGAVLPVDWRETDNFTAILASAVDQVKAMVA